MAEIIQLDVGSHQVQRIASEAYAGPLHVDAFHGDGKVVMRRNDWSEALSAPSQRLRTARPVRACRYSLASRAVRPSARCQRRSVDRCRQGRR